MTWTRYRLCAYVVVALCLHSCAIYSFSGTSLSQKVKTFSIADFESNVAEGPSDLAEQLTEALSKELIQRTTLRHEEENGDIQFEGVITQLNYSPVASAASASTSEGPQDEASRLRLTITVQVNYTNLHEQERSFSKVTFTQYEDTSADNVLDEESELAKKVLAKLIKDILNASVSAW